MIEIKDKNGLVIFSQNTFTYTGNFMGERSISCSVQSPTVLPFEQGCYLNYRNEQFKLDKTPNPTLKKISSENSIINAFQYDLKFVSLAFELQLIAFRDVVSYDSTNYHAGTSNVEFKGTVSYLTDRIQACLDAVYFGANRWTIELEEGLITTTESIKATDISCWDALALVNSTDNWKLNFYICDRHILVGTPKNRIEKSFEYGKGNGLYELSRNVVESESIITRLRVYGSDVNIPSDYKREAGAFGRVAPDYQYLTNLMLPSYASIPNYSTHADSKGAWNNYTSYSIGDLVHYSDNKQYYCTRTTSSGITPTNSLYFTEWPSDYIDSPNINKYGIREGIFRDESIRPSITGVTIADLERNGVINSKTGSNSLINEILAVSKVPVDISGSTSKQSDFYAWVRNFGFDIQSSILNGNTAKLELIDSPVGIQGFDFEITSAVEDVTSYPESKYKLTLKRNSSESFIIPNSENNIYLKSDGNNLIPDGVYAHFVITGVSMPLFLTEIAENRLLESGKNYLAKHDSPLSTYSLGVDDIEMARNRTDVHESIMEGQHIGVYDSNIGCGGVIESNGNFDTNIHPRWDSSDSAIIFGVDMFNIGILPSGIRTGSFYELGASSYIWTSDMYSSDSAIAKKLSYDDSDIHSVFLNRSSGATIIPVRDVFSGEVSMEDGTVRAGVYTDSNGVKYDGVKIGDKVWLASPLIETKYKNERATDVISIASVEHPYYHEWSSATDYLIGDVVLYCAKYYIRTLNTEPHVSPNLAILNSDRIRSWEIVPDYNTSLITFSGDNDSLRTGYVAYVGGILKRYEKWADSGSIYGGAWVLYEGDPFFISTLKSNLSDSDWDTANYGAQSVYPVPQGNLTTEADMISAYGRLYNHYSIENPLGLIDSSSKFRIPSNSDFISLENYLKSKYQTQYSFGGSNLLKSKRQVNSPLNGIGITIPINQYIPIQTLIIKEGFSQIPSYEITLSNEPVSSTLNSISSAISANSTAIGHATSSLSSAIKTTGKDIAAVKTIIPTSPTDTGSEPEITPKQNGILSWLNSSWVFLVDNFVRSDRKVNGKSLDADITLSTSDVLDTSDKRYQTDNQKLFNDATSSIQEQINGKQNLLPFPVAPTGDTFLNDLGTFSSPPSSGGGSASGTPVYFLPTNSPTSGYLELDYTPYSSVVEVPYSIPVGTTLLSSHLYDLEIATTTIDAGNWVISSRSKVNNLSGSVRLHVDFILYHIDGTETVLFGGDSETLNSTDFKVYSGQLPESSFSCVSTDRIGVKLYAINSGGATKTLTTSLGLGIPTFFSTPLRIRHSSLRDKNGESSFQHVTTNQISTWTNTSANNTGDETKITIQDKLGAASYTNSGYLTSMEWGEFKGKVSFPGFGTTHVLAAYGDHLHTGVYEVPLTFSTGLTRTGNTIVNNITQYTDALARSAQTNSSITTALGYTPWYSGNHPTTVAGYGITDAVIGTPWTSMGYLTGITSGQVTTALGYTPKPTFTENTAFNKNFGTTTGTVLEGRTFGSAANSAIGDFQPIENQRLSTTNSPSFNKMTSTVASGTAPLTVNSTTLVGNLNAQYLNGLNFNGVGGRFEGDANTLGLVNTTGIYNISSASNVPSYYGTLLGFWNSDISTQLYLGYNGDMYWRKSIGTSYTGSTWRTIYDSGNLTNDLSTNYIPKWNGSSFVNSSIIDDVYGISIIENKDFYFGNRFSGNYGIGQYYNGNSLAFYDGGTIGGDLIEFNRVYRKIHIPLTTPSTSPTTGALVVGGGIGVGGGIYSSNNIITDANVNGDVANFNEFVKSGGTASQFLKANGSVDATNYQPAITLTTNGTSGAATKIGDVINIPNYAENTSGASYGCPATIVGGLSFANIYSALYSKNNNVYSVAIRGACTSDVGANTIVSFKFPTPSAITASNIVGIGIALNDYSSMPMLISAVTGNNSQLAVQFRSTGVSGTTYTFSIIVYYN